MFAPVSVDASGFCHSPAVRRSPLAATISALKTFISGFPARASATNPSKEVVSPPLQKIGASAIAKLIVIRALKDSAGWSWVDAFHDSQQAPQPAAAVNRQTYCFSKI